MNFHFTGSLIFSAQVILVCLAWVTHIEFLTNQTTCASVLSKRTTSQKVWQKRPRAAWAVAGKGLPPLPLPAWRLAGALPPLQFPACALPPLQFPAWCHVMVKNLVCYCRFWQGAGSRGGGMMTWHQPGAMPAMAVAADPCRQWPRRHVPRVAWLLFDNTLAQVVWFVTRYHLLLMSISAYLFLRNFSKIMYLLIRKWLYVHCQCGWTAKSSIFLLIWRGLLNFKNSFSNSYYTAMDLTCEFLFPT
jgi:hypothetical protein